MAVVVKEPQQNKHRWWGILTNDKSTTPHIKDVGNVCVFIKTRKLAHYIMSGTSVKAWNVLSVKGDKGEALKKIKLPQHVKDRIKADIEQPDFPKKTAIVEVLTVDAITSTPLAKKMNALTKELFTKNKWSKKDADVIGAKDIEMGFTLK